MVDNIFSALGHRRTSGVVKEFVLWCLVCFVALMSLIAAIVGRGCLTWIMLMVFSIGLGVLMAFRLKEISLLYCAGVFQLFTFVIHYVSFSGFSYGPGYSVFNTILFVLLLLTSLALVICGFIHFFTKVNLPRVLMVLVTADSSVMMLLHILMYAAGYRDDGWHHFSNVAYQSALNAKRYWIGTITFWVMLVVVVLFYIFFFTGMLGNKYGKIIRVNDGSHRRSSGFAPGIKGISGNCAGQVVYMQGRTITIGSGDGVTFRIPDQAVSRVHCQIRYDGATGAYQICDSSTNGVYLNNGAALQKNTWCFVQRGSVICIGSLSHQFQLL